MLTSVGYNCTRGSDCASDDGICPALSGVVMEKFEIAPIRGTAVIQFVEASLTALTELISCIEGNHIITVLVEKSVCSAGK